VLAIGQAASASTTTEKAFLAHNSAYALFVRHDSAAPKFARNCSISVARPVQRDCVDLVTQVDIAVAAGGPIKCRPRNLEKLCDPRHRKPAAVFESNLNQRFVPFLRSCSLSVLKAFFKSAFSSVSCPSVRSSCAIRASSVYARPLPAKERSPYCAQFCAKVESSQDEFRVCVPFQRCSSRRRLHSRLGA